MEDIEISIVAGIIQSRIKRTRCVQRIRIWVDIEITLYLTRYSINRTAQCTRGLLLTIWCITDQVQIQLIRNIESWIQVGRITLYLTLQCPSWIKHSTGRCIILSLISTCTYTYRVVVLNGSWEKRIKPVGIAILCTTQIGSLSFWSISQSKLPGCRIILTQHLIHLTIHTTFWSYGSLSIIKITFLFQFLINRHLVLRIHDIEVSIARLQTHCIFTCIANTSLTGASFFSSNNDDTSHGTGTINRGCRTILQNLETFNIVWVQACNGWRNQGISITRR